MQYHLDGFQPGDPDLSPPAPPGPADVDVAIIGAGPAGLTLAAQLCKIGGLSVRLFERKPGPLQVGQADGIACRSMEMFEAFGIAERVAREAYQVSETAFWRPGPGGLARADRIDDVEDDLSHMPHLILNQARVHDFYLDLMGKSALRLGPDYNRALSAMTRHDSGTHPVELTFDCLDSGGTQRLRARYVVGCDGARSAVRGLMGLALQGDGARQLWGVMDVLALTDFPDIRLKCAVQSAEQGSLLIIPREGGYMVRLYIELDALAPGERAADRQVSAELLAQKAQAILAPYTLDVRQVAWFSAYEIGQRLCPRFDDATPSRAPRIFIAGDACHTHSPKAGQGMNVSMADSFNLGWKLAAVVRGEASEALLRSYAEERHAKARELIDFDRDMARLFAEKPEGAEGARRFQAYFQKYGRYTAGVETRYEPSLIVGQGLHQGLASGLRVGMRFHSAAVIRLADARPLQLGSVLAADGRWRLLAFAPRGDTGQGGALAALCADLAALQRRYLPQEGADIDARIDLRAVFQAPHRSLDLGAMPPLLLPRKGRFGLVDYEKIFCADPAPGRDIFDLRGIDRDRGALLLIRPDHHVAEVAPLSGAAGLAALLDRVLLRPDMH